MHGRAWYCRKTSNCAWYMTCFGILFRLSHCLTCSTRHGTMPVTMPANTCWIMVLSCAVRHEIVLCMDIGLTYIMSHRGQQKSVSYHIFKEHYEWYPYASVCSFSWMQLSQGSYQSDLCNTVGSTADWPRVYDQHLITLPSLCSPLLLKLTSD